MIGGGGGINQGRFFVLFCLLNVEDCLGFFWSLSLKGGWKMSYLFGVSILLNCWGGGLVVLNLNFLVKF